MGKNKTMLKFISKLFFFFMFVLLFNKIYANEKTKYISIEKHLKDRNITTNIIGIGGHTDECLDFNIQNLKNDTLFILIEPGRRIVSYDSTIQDILILKTYEISLPPLANIILKGYGFCCQSSNNSPSSGTKFNIGHMSPKTWIKFAEFIDKTDFPIGAIQNAVWVLSNNHPISSIHNEKPAVVFELKKLVAKIKKQELPWYSLTFVKDTTNLFSNRPEKLWGKIDYYVKHNTIISINVRDSENMIVATLVERIAKNPGTYSYYVKIPVLNWEKGKYTINVIEDYSNNNTKKKFTL